VSWLWAGTAILGRYVLLGQIGRGGVSVVYQGVDTVEGRLTAIKLLAPAFADDLRAWHNMHREAAITARLRHPSVPRVYDCGEANLPDGTRAPYVVLELLTGVCLAGRLSGGALPWREAVALAATVADVLAVAHRRGVVHGDLTPGNIMVTTDGLKIIDFGLATRIGVDSPAGRPADDVYALGLLLYQMLTGRSPYPTATARTRLEAAHLTAIAPTPVLLVPGLPRDLADLCRDCMAKHPAERPDSVNVALALWSILSPAQVL